VSAIQGSNENRRLGALAARIAGPAGIGGVILLVVAVLITWRSEIAWERFLRSYLVAFCFVLSLSLGGLFFTMLQHLTRAGWSVPAAGTQAAVPEPDLLGDPGRDLLRRVGGAGALLPQGVRGPGCVG
jgi:hypothetical protein